MRFSTSLLLIAALASCAKEPKYDKDKAVSAFVDIDKSRIDPRLAQTAITLPKQEKNDAWNDLALSQNQQIENFYKSYRIKKDRIIFTKKTKLWSFYSGDDDKKFLFAPIIKNDRLYALDSSGKIRATDLATKKTLFKKRIFPRKLFYTYQNPKMSAFNDTIFAVAGINRVVALDANNGDIIWSKDIASIPISTPVSDGKMVYVSTNDNKLYAFDVGDGKLEWVQSGIARPTAILGAADLVLYDDDIIAAYSSGEIYVLKKQTGEPSWSRNLNLSRAINSDFYLNDIDATPIVKDDVIYAIGNGGLMMALKLEDGAVMWKKEVAGTSNFWLAGDFLYVIDNDNKLVAMHKKTGGIKWLSQLPDYRQADKPQTKILYNGVIMAGDKLLVSRVSGKLLVISPLDGQIEKTQSLGDKVSHVPVVVNNKIYFYRLGSYIASLIELE